MLIFHTIRTSRGGNTAATFAMTNIKMIALDLDGTLLNSRKELSAENYRALEEAAARGIDPACTMAMGDALNDLQLIQAAGISVAMDNGHPSVKAQADFVTRSCDEDGVAFAVRKFCLQ